MARLTWQLTPRNKMSAYFDEIDKYRGHDMQSNEDPETASLRWFSPAYNTGVAQVDVHGEQPDALEAGYSRNLEYYTNSYQEGVEKPRFIAGMVRQRVAARERPRRPQDRGHQPDDAEPRAPQPPGGRSRTSPARTTSRPASSTPGATSGTPSTPTATSRSSTAATPPACRYSVPDSVIIRNTPLLYGERLNRDLGLLRAGLVAARAG